MDPITVQAVARATEAVARMVVAIIEATPEAARARHAERLITQLESWDRFWLRVLGQQPKPD